MSTSKTISGHSGSGFSLEHNNRDLIAKNVDVELEKNNIYYVAAGKNKEDEKENTVRFATIEEVYEKVFQPSWEEFQKRQRSDRKSKFNSYLEEIKTKRADEDAKLATQKRKYHKTKAVAYEAIFQIGNQDDTNILNHSEDSQKAKILLSDFAEHVMKLPYVHAVTTKELEDPTWEPPGQAGLLLVNLTLHGDEPDGCHHDHIDFIPYYKSSRGMSIQTGLGKTFEYLGFESSYKEKLDENGERIPKKDKNGKIRKDKDGNIIYQKEVSGAGMYDWIEAQKQIIEKEMLEKYGWERDYQGERKIPYHLDTPEYKAMREKEKLEKLKEEVAGLNFEIEKARDVMQTTLENKTQYLSEVKRLKSEESPLVQFHHAISNFVNAIKTAKTRQDIINAAIELFSPFSIVYEAIKNISGFENRHNVPKREREAPGLIQSVEDLIATATKRSETTTQNDSKDKNKEQEL